MRRLLLLAMVAVTMATMLVVTAEPASATIHSISCADNAPEGTPGEGQSPPGISEDGEPDSIVDNGSNADDRRPVDVITTEAPDESQADGHARNKECGPDDRK